MGGIDLDIQGHLVISPKKTAFNVVLVHWSRLAKGCYTSQTCSCNHYLELIFKHAKSHSLKEKVTILNSDNFTQVNFPYLGLVVQLNLLSLAWINALPIELRLFCINWFWPIFRHVAILTVVSFRSCLTLLGTKHCVWKDCRDAVLFGPSNCANAVTWRHNALLSLGTK